MVDDTETLVVNFDQDWPNVRINGTVTTPSSRTLKENIRSLSSDVATRIVSSLEPVSFSYKRHKAQSDSLGFIAEEAPPEVVADGGDAIVMNHIVAALTKVVKDQQRLIEALGARVALLENASRPVSA